MKYFCQKLNDELSCLHDGIMSCCSGQIGPIYYKGYFNEKIDWGKFNRLKEESFALLNDEDIDKSPCKGCFYLRPMQNHNAISPTYKMLHLSHWTQCNCGCIYCSRMKDSKGAIISKSSKSSYYNMLPVLKGLYKNNLLDKENLVVVFQGGDISVLKEFKDLLKECLKKGLKEAIIITNNIVYQPMVFELLKKEKGKLMTSLDAGTRETYLKLKRVDKFKETVSNLKKYAELTKGERIVVKYIIVEDYNDNIEEINKYLDLLLSIGIKNTEFQIDNKYALFTDLDNNPLPKHYAELYNFFVKKCSELNINFLIEDRTKYVIEKYGLKIM